MEDFQKSSESKSNQNRFTSPHLLHAVVDDDHLAGDSGAFEGERRQQHLLAHLQQVGDHGHQRRGLHAHRLVVVVRGLLVLEAHVTCAGRGSWMGIGKLRYGQRRSGQV